MFFLLTIFSTPSAVVGDPAEAKVQDLVERAAKGEQAAAVQLYRLYVHRVYRTLRPMCVSNAEAEDLVQESFIKAFGAMKRYRPRAGSRFISWLLTIAVNTARKRLKRKRHVPTAPEKIEALSSSAAAADPSAEAIDLAEAELRQKCLAEALGELDERSREVVTMRYGAGLSATEVADACGLSEANVRKICQRQRSALLSRIEVLIVKNEGGERT